MPTKGSMLLIVTLCTSLVSTIPALAGQNKQNEALRKAKQFTDATSVELAKIVKEAQSAGSDPVKVKTVREHLKTLAVTVKTDGAPVEAALSSQDKKAALDYNNKIQPLADRLLKLLPAEIPAVRNCDNVGEGGCDCGGWPNCHVECDKCKANLHTDCSRGLTGCSCDCKGPSQQSRK